MRTLGPVPTTAANPGQRVNFVHEYNDDGQEAAMVSKCVAFPYHDPASHVFATDRGTAQDQGSLVAPSMRVSF